MIKVKDLEMGDYPGFSERAWYNLQGSLEEVDRRVRVREDVTAEAEVKVMWPQAKECGQPLELEKAKA